MSKKCKSAHDWPGSIDDIAPELVTKSEWADFFAVSSGQSRTLLSEGAVRKFDFRPFNKIALTQGHIHRVNEQANRKTDPEMHTELPLAKEHAEKLEIADGALLGELVSASIGNALF